MIQVAENKSTIIGLGLKEQTETQIGPKYPLFHFEILKETHF